MVLLQLKYLCTAARLENFSRAAKFHNIPQSAISKTIAQLERELGVQLFARNGNRVTLNERGKLFCREVSRALGFSGPSYFSRIFKEKMGVAPSDLQKSQTRR